MNLHVRALMLVAVLGTTVLAGCGSSSSSSPSSSNTGRVGRTTYNRATTCKANQFVGNRKTHVLHRPGSTSLPSKANQVCFNSLQAAIAAGYRLSKHG